MGLLDTVADVASGVADVAPIPGSDLVAGGIDAAQEALGGGGNGGGSTPQGRGSGGRNLPVPTAGGSPPISGGAQQPPQQQPTRRDSTGFEIGGEVGIPGVGSIGGQVGSSSVSETDGGGGGDVPVPGGFQGAIMMEMLEDAVSGKDGRAVLEAMTGGHLANGVIQQPAAVSTPRGTRNVSPPGFRTVYLNDQPYAVFKPLARSLGLIGRESPKTFREKLDDTTREFLKHRKQFKDLAKKLGLKTSNRASGPSR